MKRRELKKYAMDRCNQALWARINAGYDELIWRREEAGREKSFKMGKQMSPSVAPAFTTERFWKARMGCASRFVLDGPRAKTTIVELSSTGFEGSSLPQKLGLKWSPLELFPQENSTCCILVLAASRPVVVLVVPPCGMPVIDN